MQWLDWRNMQFYHYLLIGGGAAAVLALLLAFVPRMRMQIPAAVVGTLGGLAAGAALGVIGLASFGYHWTPQTEGASTAATGTNGPPQMGTPGGPGGGGRRGGPGGGGARRGGGGGRGGPGGGGSNNQRQLVSLVAKLDVLSRGPLELRLDTAKKQKVLKELEGLADLKKLEGDVAEKKYKALISIFQEDQATLENAGFRFPRALSGSPAGAPQPANPFTDGENKQHLAALTARLKKADGK